MERVGSTRSRVELRPLCGLARLRLQIPAPRLVLRAKGPKDESEVIAPLGSTWPRRGFRFWGCCARGVRSGVRCEKRGVRSLNLPALSFRLAPRASRPRSGADSTSPRSWDLSIRPSRRGRAIQRGEALRQSCDGRRAVLFPVLAEAWRALVPFAANHAQGRYQPASRDPSPPARLARLRYRE